MKEAFIKYCNENWDLEQFESDRALANMNKYRCPLYIANMIVADHIQDLAKDFIMENDLEEDWLYLNFNDVDEVFWQLDTRQRKIA